MNPKSPAKRPWHLRTVLFVCFFLSGLVGTLSTAEAMGLVELSRPTPNVTAPKGVDPRLLGEIERTEIAALKAMQVPRTIILIGLAMICGVCGVGAYRLLKPGRVPLDAARRLTAQAAAMAAVLRTVDGAQQAVVAKRAGPRWADLLVQMLHPPNAETARALQAAIPNLSVASAVILTLAVAGTFCGVWQYLRSKTAQQAFSGASE